MVSNDTPLYLSNIVPEVEEPQYNLPNIGNILNFRGYTNGKKCNGCSNTSSHLDGVRQTVTKMVFNW